VWTADATAPGRAHRVDRRRPRLLVAGRQPARRRSAGRVRRAAALRAERLRRSAQQLTTGMQQGRGPAWSPDGTDRDLPAGRAGLQQIHCEPSDPGAAPQADHPFCPSGRWTGLVAGREVLVYTYGKPEVGHAGRLHLIRSDGTDDRPLAATRTQEWTPRGRRTGNGSPMCGARNRHPAVWAIRAGRNRPPGNSPPEASRRATLPGADRPDRNDLGRYIEHSCVKYEFTRRQVSDPLIGG